jgi:short-subunit dehydrogenase
MDITKPETIKTLIEDIFLKFHRIDVLINCAGVGVAAALEEIPMDKIKDAFDVNFFGMLQTIKEVVPVMRKNKSGLIINISSIAGQTSLPFQGVYSATKFAVEGMTEALSIELKPFGIKTCLIEPGDYKTNVSQNRILFKPDKHSPYYRRLQGYFEKLNTNIEKGLDPEKIGRLVLRIINSKNIKLRYKSGRLFEKITPMAQNIIPARIF